MADPCHPAANTACLVTMTMLTVSYRLSTIYAGSHGARSVAVQVNASGQYSAFTDKDLTSLLESDNSLISYL